MAFTSAGLWLWLGKTNEHMDTTEQIKEEGEDLRDILVNKALEDANAGVANISAVPVNEPFSAIDLLAYKKSVVEVVAHHCRDYGEDVLSSPSLSLSTAQKCCDILIQHCKKDLGWAVDRFTDVYVDLVKLQQHVNSFPGGASSSSPEVLELLEYVETLTTHLTSMAYSVQSHREDLAQLISDWLVLNPDTPITGSVVDAYLQFLPSATGVIEEGPSSTVVFSNTEIAVIFLFAASVVFFVSGLVYRYKRASKGSGEKGESALADQTDISDL